MRFALVALWLTGLLLAAPRGTNVREIIVVFKTHFDIGYTDSVANVLDRYRTSMIDQALAVCEASRGLPRRQQFVWTVPGWPLARILWPGQEPRRRQRVLAAIREGRLVWHALPFTVETESLGIEDLVRGLRYSSELSRTLGQPLPRDAKMTDVPEHTWLLPTLLRRAGIDFLHLGCNGASAEPAVPRLFWWEGPDGSKLLTLYSGQYGTGLRPPKGWPYRTWLALMMTGDNVGPPRAETVKALLGQAKWLVPGVKVRFGRLSDFADAIRREHPKLPTVRADMPDTWIHGTMSMPIETGLARNIRPQIAALESLDTLVRAWGMKVEPATEAVRQAYELSLLYGEHTWGMRGSSFGFRYGDDWRRARASGAYQKLEQSFEDHRAYIRRAESLVRPLIAERLALLAKAVKIEGARIVVFNPLPWRRTAVVRLEPPVSANVRAVRDSAGGPVLPASVDDGALTFIAPDLPPLGYRTFVPAEPEPSPGGGLAVDRREHVLQNEFFRATLDAARGGIVSLVDKRTGRELVDISGGHVLGQYLYEQFDADQVNEFLSAYLKNTQKWGYEDFGKGNLPPASVHPRSITSPSDFRVEIRQSEIAAAAKLTAPSGTTGLKIALYRGLPYLDLEWFIVDKQPDPWPEAGWLCLPLKAAHPSFHLGRTGSIIDPARDIIAGANHYIYSLDSGMTVRGAEGEGVGLVAIDSPLVSIDRPGIFRYSRDFVPKRPDVFVNLFNNQWSTNFPMWIGGSWTMRARIWSVAASDDAHALVLPSWEARVPCFAAMSDGPAGLLPPTECGLELSREGVLVTAFGRNPDGNGTLLRLWDQSGKSGKCEVRLPRGLNAAIAQPCDLRGNPTGKALRIRDRRIEVTLDAFAPSSVVLLERH